MPRFDTEPTPNPNALKITTNAGRFIETGMESFTSANDAQDHPLGSRIFSLDGVSNVFILPQFLTVTKTPAASWNDLLPRLKQLLTAYFEESS